MASNSASPAPDETRTPPNEKKAVRAVKFDYETEFPVALKAYLLLEGMSASNVHLFCNRLTDYGVRTWEHFEALALEMSDWWDTIEGYVCGAKIPRSDWAIFRKWLLTRAGQ